MLSKRRRATGASVVLTPDRSGGGSGSTGSWCSDYGEGSSSVIILGGMTALLITNEETSLSVRSPGSEMTSFRSSERVVHDWTNVAKEATGLANF